MKLTKSQLKRIIKEELEATMQEGMFQDLAHRGLKYLSPTRADFVELSKEYGFEDLASKHARRLGELARQLPAGRLRRALEKDAEATISALAQWVGSGDPPKAFVMALPAFLDGETPGIDMSPYAGTKIDQGTRDLADWLGDRADKM